MGSASLLPVIKCSHCGDNVEMTAMAEHICVAGSPGNCASLFWFTPGNKLTLPVQVFRRRFFEQNPPTA
jgi:hypothetical protein